MKNGVDENKIILFFLITYPAFRTAPVQLNDAAAVPVAFALYGDAIILSPSSSSDIAVVKLIRSSSLICEIFFHFFFPDAHRRWYGWVDCYFGLC